MIADEVYMYYKTGHDSCFVLIPHAGTLSSGFAGGDTLSMCTKDGLQHRLYT